MDEEEKWRKKIKEVLRRAERYADSVVGIIANHRDRGWWKKRWEEEYSTRVLDLSRLSGL